ncbi:MAG: FtsX-like permease family protein [Gracilimonas sp.]|nr:FtsX-like permease family protein [Gracilimonas sp.]
MGQTIIFPFYIETIFNIFGNIFAWVELQENMIPLVISGMIIVAAFNLIGAILMMVLERTRDIGILKTIGSKSKAIRRIFLIEGLACCRSWFNHWDPHIPAVLLFAGELSDHPSLSGKLLYELCSGGTTS